MWTVCKGTAADIEGWMQVVETVQHTLPGLTTEAELQEHRQTVLRFMARQTALCAVQDDQLGGVLLYSPKRSMICCLAVAPEHRRQGLASALLAEALKRMDSTRDVMVRTFRESDPQGAAPRALYQRFRFLPGELRKDNGAPTQEFVRLRTPAALEGEMVRLEPLTLQSCHAVMRQYVSDPQMTDVPYVYTPEGCDRYYITRRDDPARLTFAICVHSQPIGTIYLKAIDPLEKCATLSIALVNDAVKGHGYGTDAERTLLRYAFGELGLCAVHADAVHRNLRSQHVLEKVGFVRTHDDEVFRYYVCKRP